MNLIKNKHREFRSRKQEVALAAREEVIRGVVMENSDERFEVCRE